MTGSWVERGLCVSLRNTVGGVRQALTFFYPEPGQIAMRFRLLCDQCPVQCDCFLWGVLAEDFGGWGGTDEHERKGMRADIAGGFTTLAELLRERDCSELAARVEAEDAAAVAEASQRLARPWSTVPSGEGAEPDAVDGADGDGG